MHRVVGAPPALDDDLRLAQAVEDLAVEQLVAEPGVEALDEAVLPRAAWRDVGGLGGSVRSRAKLELEYYLLRLPAGR